MSSESTSEELAFPIPCASVEPRMDGPLNTLYNQLTQEMSDADEHAVLDANGITYTTIPRDEAAYNTAKGKRDLIDKDKLALEKDGDAGLYNKRFGFYDSMKDDMDSPGAITDFKLFFSVLDTPENRRMLEALFGKDWQDKFITDVRNDKQAPEKGEAYWFPKKDTLNKLNAEKCGKLVNLAFSTSVGTSVTCSHDLTQQIVTVVVVTYLTAGTGTGSAMAWAMAGMQITLMLAGVQMSPEMQTFMMVATMAAAPGGITGAIANMGTAQYLDLAFKLIDKQQKADFDNQMEKQRAELKEIEAMKKDLQAEARENEQRIRYMYGPGAFTVQAKKYRAFDAGYVERYGFMMSDSQKQRVTPRDRFTKME